MSLTNLIRIFFIGILLVNYMFRLPMIMDEFHISRFALSSFICLVSVLFFLPKLKKAKFNLLDAVFIGFYLINVASIFWSYNFGEAILLSQKVFLWFIVYFIFRLSLGLKVKQWPLLEKVMLALTLFTLAYTSYDIGLNLQEHGFREKLMYAVKGQAGHKNLIASFLFLLFGVNLFLFFHNGLKKWWYPVLGSQLFLMFILHSRGVYMALVVATTICLVYYVSTTSYKKTFFKRILPIGAVATILLIISVNLLGSKSVYSKYLNPATYLNSFTAQERFFVWDKTWHLIKDKPLLGYGAGSWKIIFPSKSISGGIRLQEKNIVFTRAHNDFLEVMAEQGIIGILLYLSIFGLAFWILLTTLRQTNSENKLGLTILGATLLGYMMISGFDFPKERIEHSVLLALIFAIIAVKGSSFFQSKSLSWKPSPNQWKFTYILFALILLVHIPISYFRIIGETHGRTVFAAKTAKNWPALSVAAKASYQAPWYTLDPMAVPVKWYEGSGHYMQKQYTEAIDLFEEGYQFNPYNFNVINNYGSCLVQMKKYEKAITLYKEALDINPKFEEGMFNIAFAYYSMRQYDKALEWINKTTKDDAKKNEFLRRINQAKNG